MRTKLARTLCCVSARCASSVGKSGRSAAHLQGGPWTIGTRPLRKRGRGGLDFIPLVRRGKTEIMVSTPQEAEELTAFLNYCGMDELTGR